MSVLAVLSAFTLKDLRFDYDFEAFFPNDNHELELYNDYRNTFEYDNEFVLIAPESSSGIFRKEYLLRVDSLSRDLQNVRNVRRVNSPTNLKRYTPGLVPVQMPLLHLTEPAKYSADSQFIYTSAHLSGTFFPDNARSLAIYVTTEPGLSKKESDILAKKITEVVRRYRFESVHTIGRIFAQSVYLDTLQREFLLFISIAFVLIVICLYISFRNFFAVLIPVLVVLLAILFTLAIMSILNKPVDLMTTMLPTMVFIAGMSDVVHFFSKYFDEIRNGVPRDKVYRLILKEVGFPTFLTLLTTVVGFLSLLFSSIRPVKEFGIYTSVGVTLAFILSYTFLPAVLHFAGHRLAGGLKKRSEAGNGLLRGCMFWIFRHQKLILLITAIILIASAYGISRVKVNNILLEDLSERVALKRDFMFFDKYYRGVRPFELEVTVKNTSRSVWDYDLMRQLSRVDSFIRKEYDAGFLVSPAQMVGTMHAYFSEDGRDFPSGDDYPEVVANLKKYAGQKETGRVISEDGRRARISAKLRDAGSSVISAHNGRLLNFIRQNTDTAALGFRLTGAAHLIDRNNEYMVSNMLQGFGFSVIVIALLTFLLHRSWRMTLVFILPNLVPVIVIGAIMGYCGIELKAATSLVFSIAFGIATDDTIHFISRLRIERAYGKSLLYAFKRTYFETGKPIVLTTFILIGGFISLMSSDFQSTFYFGLLICLTTVVAVIADLFLLPVLLLLIYRSGKKPA